MPSHDNPFPGMNPFLENHWKDVHTALLNNIRDYLAEQLPGDLKPRLEEELTIADENAGEYRYRADVAVVEKTEAWRVGLSPAWQPDPTPANFGLAEPEILVMSDDVERWVEVRDKNGQIITVIEVLSPSNKDSDSRAYKNKIHAYRQAGINVVEIDLLRNGSHVLGVAANALKPARGTRYLVCVTRAAIPWQREIYYCPLQEPLPVTRVPLRHTDHDVALALQPLVDRCYRMGRYWLEDCQKTPPPLFPREEEEWINEQLRAAGLR